MSRIKLLIADVDGTLLTPGKELTPRARAAVERLRHAGIAFAVTSGRPPRGMAMLVEPLRLEEPIAAFNGGLVVKPDLTTVLEQRTLPPAVAHEAVEYLLAAKLDVWVYCGSDWFVRDAGAPHVAREQATVEFAPTVIHDLGGVLDRVVKIVGVSDDGPRVLRSEAELRRRAGGRVSATRSQPYYLDVTHPDANKGMVVRLESHIVGVPPEQIATIGDGPNDVLMFDVGGMSIAMGNANAEVKRAAGYVTTANTDEGFANAVDCFILA